MGAKHYSLNDLIESLIFKASKDGVISDDEQSLINQIQVDLNNLNKTIIEANKSEETRSAIDKIFKSSTSALIQNAISVARQDMNMTTEERVLIDELFHQLGWNQENWEQRNWFVFKICVYVNEETNTREMLEQFDKVFCMWKLSNFQLKTGICLGTKHYVIDDSDVTLLAFGLHPHNSREWVRKGAFAFLEYGGPKQFSRELKDTAKLLLEEFYEKHEITA